MHWESALESAIEVAIAIAGFSGIIAAVGRRGAGQWTEPDQLRLRILLTASGAALVFAFLPFLLIDLLDLVLSWRLGSGLQVVYLAAITVYRTRQAAASGIAGEMGFRPARMIVQAGVIGLLFANAVWLASPAIYVVGVLWALFTAFLTFVRLLLNSWHGPSEHRPPAV